MPEVRACAPHPPSRARSDHTHTCRRSRTLATPSASLARPLRPSLDHDTMPRAAQRTARVARPFIGPPSSLAARPAATSKVAMDGAANELLGPKGRRATAHAHPLPPSAGANAARGHAPPPTPPTRCRPPPVSPPHAPPSPPLPSPPFSHRHRHLCRSRIGLAQALLPFCRHRRSRRSSRYAPQIFPRCCRCRGHRRPCHRGHRPCCCDRLWEPHPGCRGSRARLGGGAPRTKKKRRATVILGPTVDSERHLWCVGAAKVRLLHTPCSRLEPMFIMATPTLLATFSFSQQRCCGTEN